jgi:putative ABC transport system permease protein
MKALRRFGRRLAASVVGQRDDHRVREELAEHLTLLTEEYTRAGLPPDEAHRQARLRLGALDATIEAYRDTQRLRPLEHTWQDLHYAVRTLRRSPTFATTVIVTFALGIGANTAIFSLFEAIMLRPLPIQAADDLYFVAHGSTRSAPSSNYPYFERVRGQTDLFAGVTAYLKGGTVTVSNAEMTETARAQFVSGNYHTVIGVPMALGRGFGSDLDRPATASLEAVISEGYWTRQFGRDPQVLGRTIIIDGRPLSIVGVTAPGFDGLDPGARVDVTLPFSVKALDSPAFLTDHATWLGDMPIVVRLKSGIESAQASAAIAALFQGYVSEPDNAWLRTLPRWDRVRASLMPAHRGTSGLRDQYSIAVRLLLAMVGLVLLIGCANVANLLVARGTARAKEVAVRLSMGASRLRLVRQFVTESLLLALIGGALGFVLARMALQAIVAMIDVGANPIHLDLQPNASVLAFTIGVSVVTGLLFGLAPALGTTHVDMSPALKSIGTTARRGTPRRWPSRQVLVTVQIAVCVLLASGAGLLGRTLRNLETRLTGIDRHNLLLFSLDARNTPFPVERVPALCAEVLAQAVGRAGVISGSCSRNIPIDGRGNAAPLDVPGTESLDLNARRVFTNMVTPDYFRTFGVGLVGGRAFNERDTMNAPRVAIVNRALARFFFHDANPIGRSVHFYRDAANPMTIVGIVEDSTQRSLRENPPMTIYTPLTQLRGPETLVTVALRTLDSSSSFAESIRADVRGLAPNIVVDNVRTMEQQIATQLVRERLLAALSMAFAAIALVLSCVGLYGIVSYDVSRNLRNLSIRMALGARRLDILGGVMLSALVISSVGIVAGVLATLAGTRLLASLLFGVTAEDPLTLVAAAALLVLTTVVASYIPARRASRIDPALLLRSE